MVSTYFVELQGSHRNTVALPPPLLTGGMLASTRIAAAHLSQVGEKPLVGGIPNGSGGDADKLFKIAQ